MRLATVKIEGFKSFGETRVELEPDRLYVILGTNEDDGGVDSNGAGKTSFYEAITWALFGDVPAALESVEDVINDSRDACAVELVFDSGFRVRRFRPRGGPSGLELWHPGESKPLEFGTATAAQAELSRTFGLDPSIRKALDDFVSSVFLFVGKSGVAGGTLTNTTSVKERMDAVSRYLRLDRLDQAQAIASEKAKDYRVTAGALEQQIASVTQIIGGRKRSTLRAEVVRLKKEQAQTRKAIEKTRKRVVRLRELLAIRASAVQLKSSLVDLRKAIRHCKDRRDRALQQALERKEELKPLKARLEELRKVVKSKELADSEGYLASLQNKANEVDESRAALRKELTRAKNRETTLEHSLTQPEKCPYCLRPVRVSSEGQLQKMNVKAIQSELQKVRTQSKKISLELESQETQFSDLAASMDAATRKVDKIRALHAEYNSCKAMDKATWDYASEKARILEECATDLKPLRSSLRERKALLKETLDKLGVSLKTDVPSKVEKAETLYAQFLEAEGQIKASVASLEKDLENLSQLLGERKKFRAEQASVIEKQEDHEFWITAFANIRRNLIAEFLPALELEANLLLGKMETDMRVRIRLVTPKKSEGVKATFDILVLRKKSWRRITSLSKGEATRVGMMISLALKKLAQDNAHSQFEWIMCDEVIDTLDASGLHLFFETLAELPFQMFVVSHRDIESAGAYQASGARVLQIRKRHGVSTAEILEAT